MRLEKLSFGAPAAERDITQGLRDYFVESDEFRRFEAGQRSILLGNRGAGKSAIFKVLAERSRHSTTLVIELSPEDYSYEVLSKTMIREAEGAWAKQGAYTAAWKYLILVMVMKQLSERGARLKTGSAQRVYSYLRDRHAGVSDNPISVLVSCLKRIEGLKIGPYEAAVRTRELEQLYKLEDISRLIPDMKELCSRQNVLVLVDELDRGWDASEDAKAFVAALFQAAVSINQLVPNLRVCVSLRQELYDSIPTLYDDTQKYRDIIETISWDEPALLSLVARRIRHSIPSLQHLDDEACWQAVFADTLEYRGAKSFNYMIDRTLYRPREIIQFCTDALDVARKYRVELIDYGIISRAELQYSEGRTKDIAAEYRFQYPGLLSLFEVFRGRSYTFDRSELELICLGISMGDFRLDGTATWVKDQEAGFLIDVLWRIGFLRAQAVGGVKALRRSGSSYLGPHQVGTLSLGNLSRFHVHPMFRSFLGMKEAKERADGE